MTLPADPVWFITGCSTGFGRELAKIVLDRGWRVVATARGKDRVADIVEIAPDRALAVELDVTDQAQIDAAVAAAKDRFGRIDVLVNNAGYGYQSAIEEGEEQEIREQFADDARARHRQHRQYQFGRRSARLPGIGLLFGDQACGRGLHRFPPRRGRAAADRRARR